MDWSQVKDFLGGVDPHSISYRSYALANIFLIWQKNMVCMLLLVLVLRVLLNR